MTKSDRPMSEIDQGQDEAFHHKEWVAQRWGRVLIGALVVAAGLGFFGPGPLSHSSVGAGDMEVRYLRFARAGGSADLVVTFPVEAGEVRVALDARYLEEMTVDAVTPEPDRVISDADWTVFVFAIRPSSQTVTVTFSFTPTGMGGVQGWVQAGDRDPVTFRQFVYP